eukprot:jgi/Chlat1/6004/Chrsp4S06195
MQDGEGDDAAALLTSEHDAEKNRLKALANSYTSTKSVGQLSLTFANITSLATLYVRASEANSSSFHFRAAVMGLVITTIALSGFVLLLQATLVVSSAETKPPDRVSNLFPKESEEDAEKQVFRGHLFSAAPPGT